MKPYVHEDGNLNKLTVSGDPYGACLAFDTEDGEIRVSHAEVPRLAEAILQQGGRTAQLVWPTTVPADGKWRPGASSILAVSRFANQVRVEMDRANGASCTFSSKTAREMAGVLVTLADEAEAEPDPAAVDQLADIIGDGFDLENSRSLARKILLAGWKREPSQ